MFEQQHIPIYFLIYILPSFFDKKGVRGIMRRKLLFSPYSVISVLLNIVVNSLRVIFASTDAIMAMLNLIVNLSLSK